MTLWAIVPVKPLRRGKSRLANVLTQDERTDLNRRLLAHTLDTLTAVPEIEHVLVISRDQGALALARDYGARTVQENGTPHLNTALTRATILARNYATRGVLILPADLPLITTEDIRTLLARAIDPPVVIVEICELPSLALDMDLPEDLEIVSETFEKFEGFQRNEC
jgi:2-phospho-L-lactate guanylyltransferase